MCRFESCLPRHICWCDGIGRQTGLKILWEFPVWVRSPPPVPRERPVAAFMCIGRRTLTAILLLSSGKTLLAVRLRSSQSRQISSAIQLISFNVVRMNIIGHAGVAKLVEQRTISLCFVKARTATLNGQSVCRRFESSLPLHASFGGWL